MEMLCEMAGKRLGTDYHYRYPDRKKGLENLTRNSIRFMSVMTRWGEETAAWIRSHHDSGIQLFLGLYLNRACGEYQQAELRGRLGSELFEKILSDGRSAMRSVTDHDDLIITLSDQITTVFRQGGELLVREYYEHTDPLKERSEIWCCLPQDIANFWQGLRR